MRIVGSHPRRVKPGRRARRMGFLAGALALAWAVAGCALLLNPTALATKPVALFNPPEKVAFADMDYDAQMGKVIVPAADTGQLALIDPNTLAIDWISGFSNSGNAKQPAAGTASVTTGHGMIFALDQGLQQVDVIDPASKVILASAPVQALPELIRYVAATNELWVTEPQKEQIEVFSVVGDDPFTPQPNEVIKIPKGPQGLVIDPRRGLAYTNQPEAGTTAVIQVQTHGIIDEWGNGCSQARGMALDALHSWLFIACHEGKLVMLDAGNGGQQLASQIYGGGVDFVAYNSQLRHVYLPSADSALLAVFGVHEDPASPTGAPSLPQGTPRSISGTGSDAAPAPAFSLVRLGTADTAPQARCVTADDHGNVWVCDPARGQVFLIRDTFPAGGEAPG